MALNRTKGHKKSLFEAEREQISAYGDTGMSSRAIGQKINRTHKLIQRFLANPDTYGKNEHNRGRKSKVTAREVRKIVNTASNSTKSCETIKRELNLNVSRTLVWRVLKKSNNIVHSKMNVPPRLLPHHIIKRFQFGQNNMTRNWKNVGSLSNN